MRNAFLCVALLLWAVGSAAGADSGNLLVLVGVGKLVIIHPDGAQELIAERAGLGALSPDGGSVAFTVGEELFVTTLATHARVHVLELPAGARFGHVAWAPAGNAIAYEVIVRRKSDDLFLVSFPPEPRPPRNLGHWYQGFSFSPDGKRLIHAINLPFGLEALDIATGTRTLLHKAANVVWQAQFSPDGNFIAYTESVAEPSGSDRDAGDDAPDCSGPTLGLRLYSLRDGSDAAVAVRQPRAPASVHNFVWSPDSKSIALELGTEDCSYPSGDSTVFVATVDQKSQTQVSDASPAFQPAFSPDNSALAFVDSSQFPARLVHFDFSSGIRRVIRQAEASENYYQLLGWR